MSSGLERDSIQAQLEQQRQAAIALEAQRSVLGEAIVAAALESINQHISSLEARLLALETPGIQAAERQDLHAREERRVVTILFAEFEGLTLTQEGEDPEEVHDAIQTIWRRLDHLLLRYGGTIDRHVGTNVMAIFGAPVAREDDAPRAVHCALDLHREIEAISYELERPLGLRVGLNSGPVVAGTNRETGEFFVTGDTVNVASRMQKAAPLGGVLLTESTERAVRGRFITEALGPIMVKGKQEPIPVFLVRLARPLGERIELRGFDLPRVPTIGRERELAQMMTLYERVEREERQRLVLLCGEAGLGKSRLMKDFWELLGQRPLPPQRYMGRSLPDSINTPFFPWRVMWTSYFRLPDDTSQEQVLSQFGNMVAELWGDAEVPWREVADILAYMMGFGRIDSPYVIPLRNDGRMLRSRGFGLARTLLQRMSAAQPGALLIALEDLHWADTATLDLVEYILSHRPTTFPLLIVAALRPDFFVRRPGWRTLPGVTLINVAPLTIHEAHQLANALLPAGTNPEVYERLVAQAEGNPYYLEELARLIYEQGESRVVGAEDALPDSLRRLLQARLDALASDYRAVAQHAAAVGRIFWPGAVLATDERLPVHEALQMLEARELIWRRPTSTFPDEPEYIFKHTLVRDVAYEMLPRRERSQCHAAIAAWLEAHEGTTDEMTAAIATHYALAGRETEAIAAYLQAAESAVERAALEEATSLYQAAIDLAQDPEVRFHLLLGLERVYDLRGARVEQRIILDTLLTLVGKSRDLTQQCQVWRRQTCYFEAIGDSAVQLDMARETLALARQADRPDFEIEALVLCAGALIQRGEFPKAQNCYQEALTLAEALDDGGGQARSMAGLGLLARLTGDDSGARWFIEAALKLYQELHDRAGEVTALQQLAELHLRRGAFDAALKCLERGEEVAESLGDRRALARCAASLADLLSQRGDDIRALEEYGRCLETLQEIGDRAGELAVLLQLGRAHLRRRDIDLALSYFRQGRMLARKLENTRTEAACLQEMGDVFAELGDYLHAQAAYSNGLAIAREMGDHATIFAIQFQLALVQIWLGYSGGTWWVQAQQLLDQLHVAAHEFNMPINEAMAHLALGMLNQASQNPRQAIPRLRDAAERLLDLGQGSLAAHALATLALAYLDVGQRPEAETASHRALQALSQGPVGFQAMPRQIVFHAAARVAMVVGQKAKALTHLQTAYTLVQALAADMADEGLRASFLDQVPYNRAIRDDWQRWGQGSYTPNPNPP